jgi:Uri superfamily endonuclease
MRRGKAVHWQIDRMTKAGTVLGAWVFPSGDECELVEGQLGLPTPIVGFGSTDCARCRSHLLRRPEAKPSIAVAIKQACDGKGRSLRLRISGVKIEQG